MSTLSSASTLAEIKASYADNASYAEDNSLAKALAFKTAIILLLARTPGRVKMGTSGTGEELEHDHQSLREMYREVTAWIAANPPTSGGGGAKYFDLSNSRD